MNLLRETGGCTSNPHQYKYDAENRLISAGAGAYCYTYDGDGRRVQKAHVQTGYTCTSSSPNAPVVDLLYWLGLGLDALAESESDGDIIDEYIFFGGKRIAKRNASTGAVNYYLSDHLGTARIVTDSSGSVLDDCVYLPYGQPHNGGWQALGFAVDVSTAQPSEWRVAHPSAMGLSFRRRSRRGAASLVLFQGCGVDLVSPTRVQNPPVLGRF